MESKSNKIKGAKEAVQVKNALRPTWPEKTELPIVAFCPIPFSYQAHCLGESIHLDILDGIYAAVADSGVNTAILGVADGNIPHQMAAAKRHNVKVMLSANGAWGAATRVL